MLPASRFAVLAPLFVLSAAVAAAQQGYTAADYARAESRLLTATEPLIDNTVDGIQYLPDGRVFYAQSSAQGAQYFVADPRKGSTAL